MIAEKTLSHSTKAWRQRELSLPMRKSIKCSVIVLSVLTNTTPFYLLPSLPSGEHHLCFFTICKTTTCSGECNTLALFGSAPHTCATCQCAPHKCSAETAATATETAICTACCCVCCAVCCAALHFDLSIKGKVYLWISDFNSTAQSRRGHKDTDTSSRGVATTTHTA